MSLVLSVIDFIIESGHMLYVSNSTSTKTGTNPVCKIGEITVVKVEAGTITSSPGAKYPDCINDVSASKFAELPELHAIPNLVPM